MRLLLVEDDTMIGEVVHELLRAEHYAVDWVRDGQLADTALRTHVYGLVLLDLGLPHCLIEKSASSPIRSGAGSYKNSSESESGRVTTLGLTSLRAEPACPSATRGCRACRLSLPAGSAPRARRLP